MDVATGAGGETSSNSTIEIFTRDTLEQVGEFASNTINEIEFAQLSIAVAYWLGRGEPTPYLCWEMQGPGVEFGQEMLRIAYANVYWQPQGDELRPYQKRGKRPGYHNSDVRITLSPLKAALVNRTVTIRSSALIDECEQYTFDEGGRWIHPKTKTSRDGSARGISHGDRVVGAAMAMRAIADKPGKRKLRENRNVPREPEVVSPQSIAGRIKHRETRSELIGRALCRF